MIGHCLQKFTKALSDHGMASIGIQLNQRRQNESTLMEARMGDNETRLIQHTLIIQQEVEIERTRPLAIVLISSECPFDFAADFKQALRGDVRFDLHGAIQEPCGARSGSVLNRFGFIQRRDRIQPGMRQQPEEGDGPITKVDPIAQVGAESDKGCCHNL